MFSRFPPFVWTVLAILFLFFFLVLRAPVWAADSTVSLSPWVELVQPYVVQIVGYGLALFVGWLAELTRRKLNLSIDASHREALRAALMNAASLLIAKGGASLAGKSVDLRSPVIADAVRYVEAAAPAAIAHLGKSVDLSPAAIAEKVLAKVPQISASPAAPTGGA